MKLRQHRGSFHDYRLNEEDPNEDKHDDDQEYVAKKPQTFGPKALPRLAVEANHLDITIIRRRDEPEIELVFPAEIEHNQPGFR